MNSGLIRFAVVSLLAAMLGSACSTHFNIKPDELPDDKDILIAGAGLETIISGVRLDRDSSIFFDTLGGAYYHIDGVIRGRTWDGQQADAKIEDIEYVHVASCDTAQCVAYSIDVPTLKFQGRSWEIIDDGGKIPPVGLIEFDAAGGEYDSRRGCILAQTRWGQDVELWLSHIRYVRVGTLRAGFSSQTIGIRGSLGVSNLIGKDSRYADKVNKSHSAFSIGIVGRRWFRSWFCLQTELNFSRLEGKQTIVFADENYTYTVVDNIRLSYLEVPALARFRIAQFDKLVANVYSGGYVAVKLEAVTDFDSTITASGGFARSTYGTAKISNADAATYGVILGCDFTYPIAGLGATLDIRYNYMASTFLSGFKEPYNLSYGYRSLEEESGVPLNLRVSQFSMSFGIAIL